jgi:hypothetical protein
MNKHVAAVAVACLSLPAREKTVFWPTASAKTFWPTQNTVFPAQFRRRGAGGGGGGPRGLAGGVALIQFFEALISVAQGLNPKP